MFHFIICDIDDVFCQKEKQFIQEFYRKLGMDVEIDVYHTGEEIIALGEKVSSYDAIFLGVSIGEINGIDLGKWLKVSMPKLPIVFVSSHMDYALDGYKVGAVRYIMKDEEQFDSSMEECLNCILRDFAEDESHYIAITDEKIRVSVDKVLYVESKAHKITYYLIDNSEFKQEYTVYGKLDDAEKDLREFGFCRIHQSYLVNMNYVKDIVRYEATLLNGKEIRISKGKYKDTENMFIRIRGTF